MHLRHNRIGQSQSPEWFSCWPVSFPKLLPPLLYNINNAATMLGTQRTCLSAPTAHSYSKSYLNVVTYKRSSCSRCFILRLGSINLPAIVVVSAVVDELRSQLYCYYHRGVVVQCLLVPFESRTGQKPPTATPCARPASHRGGASSRNANQVAVSFRFVLWDTTRTLPKRPIQRRPASSSSRASR